MNAIPTNPAGWFMSEKYDGARCYLTEAGILLSRNGHQFKAPAWFTDGLPRGIRIDCELYAGRGGFDHLVSEIQRKKSDWQGIKLMVLDLAVLRVPIEDRLAALSRLSLPPHVQLADHRPCLGNDHLDEAETAVVRGGGEGLCLRAPSSYYTPSNFIKIKRMHRDLNRSVLD